MTEKNSLAYKWMNLISLLAAMSIAPSLGFALYSSGLIYMELKLPVPTMVSAYMIYEIGSRNYYK